MYEFTGEDLKFNERGQLSPPQRGGLKMTASGVRSYSWKSAYISLVFTFAGLCIIMALYLQNEDSRAALFSNRMNLIMIPVIIFVIVGILALVIFLNHRNADQLENAVLLSVSGEVRFDADSSGESGITTYYVLVGRTRFKFADDMSSTFKVGEKYRLYYCKTGLYGFVMLYKQIN